MFIPNGKYRPLIINNLGKLIVFLLMLQHPDDVYASFVGSKTCESCHQPEYTEWRSSHHFHAMEVATASSVLANFDNQTIRYNGIESRFFSEKKNDTTRFFVQTDNAKGELETFQISYTFGYEPLQQYLVDFPDGRKQVLPFAWDSRAKIEGGQRWFHIYTEEDDIDFKNPLHWTGFYFNWNNRCASCHSTDLNKNYDINSNTYATHWQEINVACEACHGEGSHHLAWANAFRSGVQLDGELFNGVNKGWEIDLKDSGQWYPVDQETLKASATKNTFQRNNQASHRQKQVCASCHSRRSEIEKRDPVLNYHDTHQLSLLEPISYHADGQIQDEVYVYGSFLQSKMHKAGVTCTNCHNPHSGELKIKGNGLCLQCHEAQHFDTSSHHRHSSQAAIDDGGSECISCHMPETTYMVIDDRADHSFIIPRPELSQLIGAPDPCTTCHEDQDHDWAQRAINEWHPNSKMQNDSFATTNFQQRTGAAIGEQMLALSLSNAISEIERATLLSAMTPHYNQSNIQKITPLLDSKDPLVRYATLRSLEGLPMQARWQLAQSKLKDRSKLVRIESARILADVPVEQLPPTLAQPLIDATKELLAYFEHNNDTVEVQSTAGNYFLMNYQIDKAEQAYMQALKLAPQYIPALLNLADLQRGQGDDENAMNYLLEALRYAPDSVAVQQALGLAYVRQGDTEKATTHLAEAYALAPDQFNTGLYYLLILEKSNRIKELQAVLTSMNVRFRNDPRLMELNQKYQRSH